MLFLRPTLSRGWISYAGLLLYKFPNYRSPVTGQPHKIDPAGQVAYINLRFSPGDLAREEFLTARV